MSSQFIVINEIEELLNEMNDGLNTNINALSTNLTTVGTDVSAIKTNTAANSTENSTGTLSQKLTYLINRRDRIVTPSSTNIKTLAASKNITASAKRSDDDYTLIEDGSNSVTYSTYVKYPGTYRVYVTYSTTKVSNIITSENCTIGKTGTHSVKTDITVSENNSVYEVSDAVSGYYDSGIASVTKTWDVFCNCGAQIKIKMTLYSNGMYDICGGPIYCASHRLDISNVSIRGTLNEINSATT